MKKCSKCKKSKSVVEFSARSDRAGKLRSQCKKCVNDYGREKHAENLTSSEASKYRKAKNESARRSRENNPEAYKEYWERVKKENPEYYKFRRRRDTVAKYGLTLGQFDSIESLQNYLCPICVEPKGEGKNFCVDHCHETGEVRGLLCKRCNAGIGLLRDNPELLLRAIEYLNNPPVRGIIIRQTNKIEV